MLDLVKEDMFIILFKCFPVYLQMSSKYSAFWLDEMYNGNPINLVIRCGGKVVPFEDIFSKYLLSKETLVFVDCNNGKGV